jgi:hypothetical protein
MKKRYVTLVSLCVGAVKKVFKKKSCGALAGTDKTIKLFRRLKYRLGLYSRSVSVYEIESSFFGVGKDFHNPSE